MSGLRDTFKHRGILISLILLDVLAGLLLVTGAIWTGLLSVFHQKESVALFSLLIVTV
jgi:hypothetical protein